MNRRELLVLVGLVLLAGFLAHLLRCSRPLGRIVGTSPAAVAVFADHRSPAAGSANANLTVFVFADYQCPACRKAHTALHAAVADDGKIRLVYKDWPIFGERSVRAARIALASDLQGVYPSVHHQLMTRSLDATSMRRAVELSGGNWQRLEADLVNRGARIDAQLAANQREAIALGLVGTPGYLIGPLLIKGALTQREFRRAFAQARSWTGEPHAAGHAASEPLEASVFIDELGKQWWASLEQSKPQSSRFTSGQARP